MPLTRSRRRILIAATAVVGILVVWWMLTPQVDARFVGKWEVSAVEGVYETWDFDANGIMHSQGVENDMYSEPSPLRSVKWCMKGELLCIGSPHPEWLDQLAYWLDWEWCF